MTALRRGCLAGALLLSTCATACGQAFSSEFSIAYESALLDSLVRYELLKPTFQSLEYAYAQRTKEAENLRNTLRMSTLQTRLQEESYQRQLTDCQRKQRRTRNWGRVKTLGLIGAGAVLLLK